MGGSTVGTGQHQDIVVVHFFLLVGQLQEFLISHVETFALHFHAQHAQTVFQSRPSATCGQNDGIVINTHILGIHDFVGLHILQYTVLMDSAGMGEGITSHDGLVGLYRHVHQAGHQTARRIYLLRIDIGIDADSFMAFKNHGHFFERGIPRTLTDTVNGDFRLAGTVHDSRNRIGSSHAQVIMAMCGQDSLAGRKTVHMFHQIFDFGPELLRQAISRRVGNVHHRRTGLYHGIHHTGQIFIVRTPRILCIELHVLHITFGILHGSHGTLDDFLTVGIELIFNMGIRSPYAGMYPLVFGSLQSLGCHIDIFLHRTGQRTNRRPCHCL